MDQIFRKNDQIFQKKIWLKKWSNFAKNDQLFFEKKEKQLKKWNFLWF